MSESGEEKLKHLDEMTCLLYLERQLDRARGLEVSAHTKECDTCGTLLRALERESRLLTRAMLEDTEPVPSRLAQFQEKARRSMQWIGGLAFGLAATGAYALYTGYIEPWQQQLEQAGFGGSNLLGLLIFQGAVWKGWQSMITILEAVALVTLGGVGAMLLRRRIRRGSALALVFASLCAALMWTPGALAAEKRTGQNPTVAKDETIQGDIFLSGERVRVEGTVDGDVFAVGKDIDIDGHVTGDVVTAGRYLRIPGIVDGNVRSAGNTVVISGTVGKNITWFGDAVTVESAGKVVHGITMFGGTLAIDGHVGRDILFYGEEMNLNGVCSGSVREKGNMMIIGSNAQVDGTIHFEGNKPAEVAAGAKLASPVEFKQMEKKEGYRTGHYYVWQVIWLAAFILYGLVLFSLMPRFAEEAVKSAEQYGASAGLGVLTLFGVPIAALIACVTVVGLFIGLSTLFLWYASLYFAQVIVGTVVGQWLMGRTSEFWPFIGRMTVGVVMVRLLTTIPEVGGWVKFVAILWGVGAISLAIFRRFQPALAAGGAPTAPAVQPLPPNTTIGGPLPA